MQLVCLYNYLARAYLTLQFKAVIDDSVHIASTVNFHGHAVTVLSVGFRMCCWYSSVFYYKGVDMQYSFPMLKVFLESFIRFCHVKIQESES